MQRIEKDIEVNAPLSAVYNQWTQFEEFPLFMEGVKSVQQIDEKRLLWRAKILGQEIEWEAEIFEQVPDERISWRSTSGHVNMGSVHFVPITSEKTKVTLIIDYVPVGVAEKIADAIGVLSLRIEADLRSFRTFIESRGEATGGWRGKIPESTSVKIPA